MKKITIGTETFTVYTSKYITSTAGLNRYAHRTLYQCYERPSSAKQYIYGKWLKWACENNIEMFGVSSYNCYSFSLQGYIEIDGNKYILFITPSYNKAYTI